MGLDRIYCNMQEKSCTDWTWQESGAPTEYGYAMSYTEWKCVGNCEIVRRCDLLTTFGHEVVYSQNKYGQKRWYSDWR